jgi:hypothetical protein
MKNEKKINNNEVKSSKEWLQKFIIPRKTINKEFNTYQLKHCAEKSIEKSCDNYISLESFVQAVLESGYRINKKGYINADYSFAKKHPKESIINKPY